MSRPMRCDGCSRPCEPDALFICRDAHVAIAVWPEEPPVFMLCAGCLDAHIASYQMLDGSHWPPAKWIN